MANRTAIARCFRCKLPYQYHLSHRNKLTECPSCHAPIFVGFQQDYTPEKIRPPDPEDPPCLCDPVTIFVYLARKIWNAAKVILTILYIILALTILGYMLRDVLGI